MVQTSVGIDQSAKYEGRLVYPNLPNEKVSKTCEETAGVNFGRVVALAADADKFRRLRSNQITLTFSADLVASNTIDGDLVVNGTSASISQVTYASSHANTMGLIQTAIEALTGVASTSLGADSSGNANRVITVTMDPETDAYGANWTVAAGASQATITEANSDSGSFFGVTLHAELEQNNDGTALYESEVVATIGRDVYVDVRSDDALTVGSSVYVRFYDESSSAVDKAAGMLMSSNGLSGGIYRASLWANAEVYNGCSAGGIATIRVRV